MNREFLRSETTEQHLKMEAGSRIMKPDFTLEEYQALLKKWYVFYREFEVGLQLQAADDEVIAKLVQDRWKTSKLAADLAHFKFDSSISGAVEDRSVAEFCARLSEARPRIVGALYVLEGSTLGARMIAESLRQRFGLLDDAGLSFYAGYKSETGSRWKSFVEMLDAVDMNTQDRKLAALAANEVFVFLERHLST